MLLKFTTFILICTSYVYAIGGTDSLPDNSKKIVKSLQTTLELNEKDSLMVFKDKIEPYLNSKNWTYYFFTNDDLSKNKIATSKNKIMFFTLLNTDRIINTSFVKFNTEKQLAVYSLETLPRNEEVALDKFNELEKDKDYTKGDEAANYGYFNQNGYTSRVNIFVSSPVGSVQFSDYVIYDLEQ